MDAEQSPAKKLWSHIWTAIVACVILLLAEAVLFPVFAQVKTSGPNRQLSRVKEVGIALLEYTDENDQRFPPNLSDPATLHRVCLQYLHRDPVLPSGNAEYGEVLANGLLSGKSARELAAPATTVLAFNSRPKDGRGIVCYADGHARVIAAFESMLQQLTVDPVPGESRPQGARP